MGGAPGFGLFFPGEVLLNRFFVKGRGFAFFDSDGALRTFAQAVAETVTVSFAYESRLAVHHLDRTLVAGVNAKPAAVALFLVDSDDLSTHC